MESATICEICAGQTVSPGIVGHISGYTMAVCPSCAQRMALDAGADGESPAAGYCRCGAYVVGLAQFIRHVMRCGESCT